MNTSNSVQKTASSSLPVGTRLGEFEITGVIGEGGFGIVYSAHDSSLERIVALKEYLPSAFAQRGADGGVEVKSEEHRKTFMAGLSSFINEAKMLAKFSHPGLVEVFRFWEANGTAYMAMRYYRGVTLRETLRTSRQQITEQWLCETLDPILLALKELHNERCFHRDIAPDNIMVLPNGKSVLMDFGAARRIISGMTQALTTILKPGYAPIEQYYDDGSMPQGAWTDIYAIGGLLYHLMTGKVPVQAISRMMSDPLKPVAANADGVFSPQLCSVVMKCLAVLPENRYQSVDELRSALGWISTPVVSTVMHKPMVAPVASPDFQATMIMEPTFPERRAMAELTALSKNGQAPAREPARAAPKFDPDATMVVANAVPVSAMPTASIDDFLNASSPPPPNNGVNARGNNKEPQAKALEAKLPVVSKKSHAGLWIAVATVFLVVAGAGLFFSGVLNQGSPASVVADAGHAPGNVIPAPVSVAPVASPPAVSLPASDSAVAPAPNSTAPVDVVVQAPMAVSSVPLNAATPASAPVTPKTGNVRIEVVGGWGNVFVDGQAKGTVPPVLVVNLPVGSHDIEIQNPASPTQKKTVTVVAGKTMVVRHSFAK